MPSNLPSSLSKAPPLPPPVNLCGLPDPYSSVISSPVTTIQWPSGARADLAEERLAVVLSEKRSLETLAELTKAYDEVAALTESSRPDMIPPIELPE